MTLVRRIQLAASELGARLFRNNVGVFRTFDGRVVKAGLCNGSSDLIGFTPVTINGKTLAVFTAVEVKTSTGRLSKQQSAFLAAVKQSGGIAIEARSVEDVINSIRITKS